MHSNGVMYSPPSGPPPNQKPKEFPSPDIHKPALQYAPPPGPPPGCVNDQDDDGAPSMPMPTIGGQPRSLSYPQKSNSYTIDVPAPPSFPVPEIIRTRSPVADTSSTYPNQTWNNHDQRGAQEPQVAYQQYSSYTYTASESSYYTTPVATPTSYSAFASQTVSQGHVQYSSAQSSFPPSASPVQNYEYAPAPAQYAPPPGPPPPAPSTPSGGFLSTPASMVPPPAPGPPRIPSGSSSPWRAPTIGPPPAPIPDTYNSYQEPPAHMPPVGAQYSTPTPGGQRQRYAWSQCTGNKKALLIGINYFGQRGELRGCINDANNMRAFIISHFGFKSEDIVMLTDDSRDPSLQPTKAIIEREIRELVKDAKRDDSLFFHFSGHGGYTKDKDGDEADGYDEVIYPVDFGKGKQIVDDDLHRMLVRPLPEGCQLIAIFDSCHSGSALDLPYVYSSDGKLKQTNNVTQSATTLADVGKAYMAKDLGAMFRGAVSLANTASGFNKLAEERARVTKSSAATVISWAGCKDSQTSADVVLNGKGTGAMSLAFMSALRAKPKQTYRELLVNIRRILREKYSQKPQLSSSHEIDTSVIFVA